METIKWLLQKAFENDYNVLITKSKSGDTISLKCTKKLKSGKMIDDTVEFEKDYLDRIEPTVVGDFVKSIFDRTVEKEKFYK